MILSDDEIISEKNNHFYEDRYGETFNFLDFARAIEAAIIQKIGEPVAWMMVNETCPSLKPVLVWEPKTDWHITWKAVPLYALEANK